MGAIPDANHRATFLSLVKSICIFPKEDIIIIGNIEYLINVK